MPESSSNRGWLWFLGLLLFMTVAGICLEIWFNEKQRLKPEQLTKAKNLWKDNRPSEYEMDYTVQDLNKDPQPYRVRVFKDKDKQEQFIFKDGDWISDDVPYSDLDELFDKIDEQLQDDLKPGRPRIYTTCSFDRGDGHITRYVRSVRSERERLEVNVLRITEIKPPEDEN